MPVEVKLPTLLRSHADGRSAVQATGATVGEVVRGLVDAYPGMAGSLLADDGDLHRFVNVYRNDEDIRYLEGFDTAVDDGDVLSIIPAVAGG